MKLNDGGSASTKGDRLMKNKRQLSNLVRISRQYGSDTNFIIAGGGNTSFKTKDTLFVKASGTLLGTIAAPDFAAVDRKALAKLWTKRYPVDPTKRSQAVLADLMAARLQPEKRQRPSVETLMHEAMPQTYAVHTHPTVLNGLGCGRKAAQSIRRLFGDSVVWIPYVYPGYTLATRVRKEVARYTEKYGRPPSAIFLGNHGVMIAADTVAAIRRETARLVRAAKKSTRREADLRSVPFDQARAALTAPALRGLLAQGGRSAIVTFAANRETATRLANRASFAAVSSAFSPDHIVFCKHAPLFVQHRANMDRQYAEIERGIAAFRARHGTPPAIVAVQNLGVFAAAATKLSADLAMTAFFDTLKIAAIAESHGGSRFMTRPHIDFIGSFEAESYRRKIMDKTVGQGRASGKVAIVTGAAQGFGKGLAEALAREGAYVIVADINGPLARRAADEICRTHGTNRAKGIAVDVTSGSSIENLLRSTALTYGGVDLFVSNAGILRAGGLDEMSAATFEAVTRVNYTGYFLCVKHTSSMMKLQRRFAPHSLFDIVQINSKSGLAGSKSNFAYAGGKFGGIGLTQSFALELVEHGIKVNAICPGNFFEGPLWADPKNGLFVQYLRAKKVPGARSVADVKKFYESKVPMRRGCTVEDVARAVFYVMEQNYETGQAVPVTGGQVMLS
jgi:NAD(P)-dependent dehydrogenase (short-subunit alcohol dehydrogenase family)/rhamnose utilization protein RhaD (predicted bifunctional aldolase and dehydrogenase)